MTYRLTTAGRMAVLAQFIAVVLVFGFAVWMLGVTLGINWLMPISSFQAARPTWTSGELVPAFFLAIVLLATPLLAWQLLGELFIRYHVTDEGLRIASVGIQLALPWETIRGLRPAHHVGLTERTDLILKEPLPRRLGLWLINARQSLPVYAGVGDRETLLATIRDRVSQPTS